MRTIKYRVDMKHIESICKHHLAAYSRYFNNHVNRSKLCSDPFKNHTDKNPPLGMKSVSLTLCDSIVNSRLPFLQIKIFPGMKVCSNCNLKLLSASKQSERPNASSSSSLENMDLSRNDDVFLSALHGVKVANEAAGLFGITPVKIDVKESKSKRVSRIMKKGEELRGKFEQVLQESLINEVIIPSSSGPTYLQSDFETLMSQLKDRCAQLQVEKDHSAIITLLTLAPTSWTISVTASYFCVSESEVRRSRILTKEKGILSTPNKRKGRPITDDEQQIVKEFYEADENSRMQPGMKDVVSVRVEEGKKKSKCKSGSC